MSQSMPLAPKIEFHVGPVLYRLVISDRAIFDERGDELEGLAHEGRRLLILSPRVEPDRREEVALHELAHAYQFHFPSPGDDEERAQLFATAAKQLRLDLEAQGGAEALLQIQPQRVPHLGKPAPARTARVARHRRIPDRITCGCCEATIMCGSIHNGEPAAHEATGQCRIERWTSCDCCLTLMVWIEVCTPDGTPLGQYVANPAPQLLRGREASGWLVEKLAESQAFEVH